ncbi:MAG: serine/threonine protein phosphatase [Novosphingobium sp.]|nr:serine/threonine protein phosphatase [Novosphingobium sp.]
MLPKIRKLLGARQPARPAPAVPEGQRAYAIGDIHGRNDLFTALIAAVEADDRARGPAETTVVLLGDLIDRGADSAGVIDAAREWQRRRPVRIIMGNHEEMLLECFEDQEVLRHFLRYGGRETLLSYPIDPDAYTRATLDEVDAMMRRAVPEADLAFIRSFENHIAIGDYLFVHAGIRPEVALDAQTVSDLRWIREPFLGYRGDHGCVVVHGHTIYDEPQVRANRISIDTGAYLSGTLTALGLEGTARWLIETHDQNGVVTATQRSAS